MTPVDEPRVDQLAAHITDVLAPHPNERDGVQVALTTVFGALMSNKVPGNPALLAKLDPRQTGPNIGAILSAAVQQTYPKTARGHA